MSNIEPRITVKKTENDERCGQFVVEPLMHTFGHTIGNALRRVLLSNIEGAAVTSIKIKGIEHEFQTIDGVKEDVTEFMLNMRGLYVKLSSADNSPRTLTIDVKGKGVITGADIQCIDQDVVIVNPDVYLCEITDENAELYIEMTVEKGMGFVLPEKQRITKESKTIGIIPMASVFTPVIKVSYEVEPTRVGHDVHLERLVLNIETNGTINAQDVLVEAAGILIKQFNLIRSCAGDVAELPLTVQDIASGSDPKLNTSIDDLVFGHRTANCLRRENIKTVRELLNYTESDLLKLRSFGKKSLDEVVAKLEEMGLHLNP